MNKIDSDNQLSTSNVIGLVKISDHLNLEKIYAGLDNTSYEPEQFSGLIYRNEEPPGTVTLFKTGNVICSGANDTKNVRVIISNLLDKLRFLDIPIFDSYKIQIKNIVSTKSLNQSINLAKVALSFGLENVDYEPDDFPGLIYKTEEPRATFIIFESGKIICTGAESNSVAEMAFHKLEKKFIRYKII
jgi:transcription initiation factor TFIID TATA-box-binding protein